MKTVHHPKGLVAGLALLGLAAGAAAQEIKLSPSSVQFGRVSGTKSRSVKIQNKGTTDLMVGPIALCPGTSGEFSFSLGSSVVPARRSTDLRVAYTPAGAGDDQGCLDIPSNDPGNPLVQLRLAGSGARDNPGELRLRPTSLDFGRVKIGAGKRLTFQVQTTGGASVDLTVAPCAGTSAEYSAAPGQLTVAPGRGASVGVTYLPVDVGTDPGCVDVVPADPTRPALVVDLTGTGVDVTADPAQIDLDIHDFKVKKESRLKSAQPVQIRLWVKNTGSQAGSIPATVVGTQNTLLVYEQTLPVADRPGNEGVAKFTFPSYTPTQIGDIVWTATLEDDDPDLDTATAVTRVIGDPVATTGVDLDIRRFRVTSPVSASTGKPIQFRLAVQNNGDLDEARDATLVGIQDGFEVHSETIPVSDSIGNRGATNYRFAPYFPASAGEIIWMVVVDDDDVDADEAFAVSRVVP